LHQNREVETCGASADTDNLHGMAILLLPTS
jgi:hypothetical protein